VAHGIALSNALALAKVMVVARKFRLADQFEDALLIYTTLLKSAAFTLCRIVSKSSKKPPSVVLLLFVSESQKIMVAGEEYEKALPFTRDGHLSRRQTGSRRHHHFARWEQLCGRLPPTDDRFHRRARDQVSVSSEGCAIARFQRLD
jgi:hypothetical protein